MIILICGAPGPIFDIHLGVEVLQNGAEVGREEVVACGRPLPPFDEGRPGRLQHVPAHADILS